ncbi:hypothetical protein EMCRGX_G029394 [Ephydatia muelleri]
MWCTLFYSLFLVVAAVISPSRAQENNDPACATYATATYPKTLRCPCSSEDEVSVTWCLTCPIGGSGICFNSTSVTSVIGDCLRSYTNGQLSLTQYSTTISFRNDTSSIYISTIDLTYRLTTFNCTCQCNGSRCGEKGNFTLAIDNPGRMTFSIPRVDGLQAVNSMIYGAPQILCVSGSSDSYTNATWIKNSALSIPAQDVTNNFTCNIRNCQTACLQKFRQLYRASTSSDHYTAYLILPFYQFCSQSRLEYVSVLFINRLSIGDEGLYTFHIVSSGGNEIPSDAVPSNSILVSPAYGSVTPDFHCTSGSDCSRTGTNAIFSCNVTLTYNSSVQWFHKLNTTLPPVPIPYIQYNISTSSPRGGAGSRDLAGEAQLADLCRDLLSQRGGVGGAFALFLGQTTVTALPQEVTATLHRSTLVVCGASEATYGYYYGQVGAMVGPGCRLSSTPGFGIVAGTEPSTGLTVLGVVVTFVLFVMVVVAILFVRVCWARRKAVNIMAPVSLHMRPLLLHQASSLLTPTDETGLLSALQAPKDQWEFPRANLEFVALLGEGQFGQVWKAQATGICSDEGRNIVAVKTVKPHASPIDVDELYAELEIMKHIEPHPNILNLLGQCSQTDAQPLCILMEFACYGSLKDYLQRCGEHIRQRSSSARASSSDTLSPPVPPLPSHHVCDYHHQVLEHLNDYLTQAAKRESCHDYLPMKSVMGEDEEEIQSRGGRIETGGKKEGLPRPSEGGSSSNPYQEAWRLSATNRLATPDPGLQSSSNRSSYVYPQEQLSECGRAEPSFRDLQDQQWPSEQGTSLGSQQGTSLGGQQGTSLGGQQGTSLGGQQGTSLGGQQGTSLGGQQGTALGGQQGTPLGSQQGTALGGQQGTSLGGQQGTPLGGQHAVPEKNVTSQLCPVGGQRGRPRVARQRWVNGGLRQHAPPLEGTAGGYLRHAEHYRNLERREGLSPEEGRLTEMAEPVELMTSDILNFALQIVRGMEHLENMKYVHRDLAARNVLIAEGFLLKIGDFGLTRDLSEREYYKKITAGKLPARWMAIESLMSRRHTYKSDVWSFGVVLWEMFTYGAIPYGRLPAANSCDSLANYLKRGERLAQPPNCSDDLYQLMLRCWNENVDLRPSFSDLKRIFDDLLSSTHGYLRMVSDTANDSRPATHETHTAASLSEPQQQQPHTPSMLSMDPEPLIKCAPISTLSPLDEDCSPQQGDRAYIVTRPVVQSRSLDFKETVF